MFKGRIYQFLQFPSINTRCNVLYMVNCKIVMIQKYNDYTLIHISKVYQYIENCTINNKRHSTDVK